jgi:predicted nucleic acid-binding protein
VTLVFNASPVIVLAKAGLLETLSALGSPALIPQAVVDEILKVNDPMDPARLWFEGSGAPFQRVATPPMSPFLAGWDLGPGESSVISIATGITESVAVLDDLAARRCAQSHGIPITGTLGLVLLAKKHRLIPDVTTALESIVNSGLFISRDILAKVRKKAGE